MRFASDTSEIFNLFPLTFTWIWRAYCMLCIFYLSYLAAIFAPFSCQYMTSLNLSWAQWFSTKRDLLSLTIVWQRPFSVNNLPLWVYFFVIILPVSLCYWLKLIFMIPMFRLSDSTKAKTINLRLAFAKHNWIVSWNLPWMVSLCLLKRVIHCVCLVAYLWIPYSFLFDLFKISLVYHHTPTTFFNWLSHDHIFIIDFNCAKIFICNALSIIVNFNNRLSII